MKKPRIIIADTDRNYIFPLLYKFVIECFDKLDLEIVDNSDYFEILFAQPQSADVLIISEDLYDSSIHRHSIDHIFLMTEQLEEEQTANLNVNQLFKYTSIKEIFNEITSKSEATFEKNQEEKKQPKIILVSSACGGVGKTTVAMGISTCLTKNYKRVLYLNASRIHSFQSMLENPIAISNSEVYANLENPSDKIYYEISHVLRKELFHYLPPLKASLLSLGLSYSIYQKIALSAKESNDFDMIVIDADSVFDEDCAELFNIADKVIIVVNQTRHAIESTNALLMNLNEIDDEKYIYICNDFDKKEDNALISSRIQMKFTVNDYVEHFLHYDDLRPEDFAKEKGIQKISYLIL